jgi:hypothetical protein
MPRRRRRFESMQCYEICFRARSGLPFVAYWLIRLIISAVVARVQRDDKVILCHDIWNGSHAHLFVIALDAENLKKFYGEIQKMITEMLKRLLGLDHLSIWEGTPMVAIVLDQKCAEDRIAYFYANPAQDNLVDSIDKFPGYSSWNEFFKSNKTLNYDTKETVPWIRLPSIPKLDYPALTIQEDLKVTKLLKKLNKSDNLLIRKPHLWLKVFGVTSDSEVTESYERIIRLIREREDKAREKRKSEGKSVLGADALCGQEILKPHKPKKKDRRIFVLTFVNELRMSFIEEYKHYCEKCTECFDSWRKGNYFIDWPPGAFKPPLCPSYNIVNF